MVIRQGDVFWYNFGHPVGSEPGYQRPVVIMQNDAFNQSAIKTTVVCAITTNLELGQAMGNLRLRKGEANLPQASVVNISQVYTINKTKLQDKLGSLSPHRVQQIIAGLHLLFEPQIFA